MTVGLFVSLQLKMLCEGVISTVGRMSVGNWSVPFTAHPKLDVTTGIAEHLRNSMLAHMLYAENLLVLLLVV